MLHIFYVALVSFAIPSLTLSQDCAKSDQTLYLQREKVCSSLVQGVTPWCGTSWKNVSADHDWPNQAVYFQELLNSIASDATCLNTSYGIETLLWVNNTQGSPNISGNFMNTWLVFQVQYYDMPRLPGTRIESPDTLGRKCWAFAYLAQFWNVRDVILERSEKVGVEMLPFVKTYDRAIPLTLELCDKVLANCFVNASYSPSRNGTCPWKVKDFKYLGFDRENIKRKSVVKYPFH